MSMLQDMADGLKAIAEHFPNAMTGAEHDQFYVYSGDMNLEYFEERPLVKKFIEDCGFFWDDDHDSWMYYT